MPNSFDTHIRPTGTNRVQIPLHRKALPRPPGQPRLGGHRPELRWHLAARVFGAQGTSTKPTKVWHRHASPHVMLSLAVANHHPAQRTAGTPSVLRSANASCSPAPRAVCGVAFFVAFVTSCSKPFARCKTLNHTRGACAPCRARRGRVYYGKLVCDAYRRKSMIETTLEEESDHGG